MHHYLHVIKPAVIVVSDNGAAEALEENNASDLKGVVVKVKIESRSSVPPGWISLIDLLTTKGDRCQRRFPKCCGLGRGC